MQLKEDKGTGYDIGWKSKVAYTSTNLIAIFTAFLHKIKHSGYRIRRKFNNGSLVVKQNNCTTERFDAHIVYDLNGWIKILHNNFKLKNCLFKETNIRKKLR